jgi:hypothetical protein
MATPRRYSVASTVPKEVVTLRNPGAGSKLLPLGCPARWTLPLEWLRSESLWDRGRLGLLSLEDNWFGLPLLNMRGGQLQISMKTEIVSSMRKVDTAKSR